MCIHARDQNVGITGGRGPVGSDHPERLGAPPLAVGSSESIHPYGTHSKLWATSPLTY